MAVKKTDERRSELINTAAELFVKNGFYETSVSDIVKACGVAQGTFYYHFSSKEQIFAEVVKELPAMHFEKLRLKLKKINGAKNKLIYLADIMSDIAVDNKHKRFDVFPVSYAKLIFGMLETISKHGIEMFKNIISEGIADGEFHVVNADFIAVACVGIFKEIGTIKFCAGSLPWSKEQLKQYIISFFDNLVNWEELK